MRRQSSILSSSTQNVKRNPDIQFICVWRGIGSVGTLEKSTTATRNRQKWFDLVHTHQFIKLFGFGNHCWNQWSVIPVLHANSFRKNPKIRSSVAYSEYVQSGVVCLIGHHYLAIWRTTCYVELSNEEVDADFAWPQTANVFQSLQLPLPTKNPSHQRLWLASALK